MKRSQPPEPDRRVAALSLAVPTPAGEILLRASVGAAHPGGPQVLDEHFVVNADARHEPGWLDCADLLYGSRPRGVSDAVHWLHSITAGRGACRMAAVPLVKGGWAVLDTVSRQVTLVPVTMPHGQWLWPSCLLGWLTAGGDLQDLTAARPAYHSPAEQGG
ncbi:hypothetical protein OG552_06080 [Streptomyces sp. NBC_01476]|uniref:hypothetical protein n=1 Tax=Streptomyces sp. NBC_01476 TaxID=2903881 RepID=UPI002E35EE27|nr:hypothetical protein [Streptomyces sp. NBC_01476]